MSDLYYCKLYVDTDEDLECFESSLNELSAQFFIDIEIEHPVYNNEDFDPIARTIIPYEFIECSRYYVDLAALQHTTDQIASFQSGVALLVRGLREGGRFVTVSCDFEDEIADATGWNWSESTPEPPGRGLAA